MNTDKSIQNIEDTVTQPNLPSNVIPMVSRLLELVKSHQTNDPNVLIRDLRIRKCYLLLRMTMERNDMSNKSLTDELEAIRQLERLEVIDMSFEQWENEFHPVKNTVTKRGEFGGFMFETHGKDLDHVARQPQDKIWTLVDVFDGSDQPVMIEGYHKVNRICYFITQKAYNTNKEYNVTLDS